MSISDPFTSNFLLSLSFTTTHHLADIFRSSFLLLSHAFSALISCNVGHSPAVNKLLVDIPRLASIHGIVVLNDTVTVFDHTVIAMAVNVDFFAFTGYK